MIIRNGYSSKTENTNTNYHKMEEDNLHDAKDKKEKREREGHQGQRSKMDIKEVEKTPITK